MNASNNPGGTPPKALIALGWSGAIPFAALAIDAWAGTLPSPTLLKAGVLYGALILSFLGGAHWGLLTASWPKGSTGAATAAQGPLVAIAYLSVAPCLVAWFALLLLEGLAPLIVLIVGFPCVYAVDRQLHAWGLAPAWWPRYRLQLTLFVTSLLAIALGGLLFNA